MRLSTVRTRSLVRCLAQVVCLVACALVGPGAGRVAADEVEPVAAGGSLHDRLDEQLKKPWLSVGFLLQVVADLQPDRTAGSDGFSLGAARLSLRGQLDEGFSYLLQGSFVDSPSLLDARISYAPGDALTIDAGVFKAPFSAEFQTSAAATDFINRSRVVSALAPGRQLGAQLRGEVGGFEAWLGVFNGNRFRENRNDDSDFLTAGRLVWRLQPTAPADSPGRSLTVGVSLAHSNDADVDLGSGLPQGFRGERRLAGVDLRFERERLLVSAEGIWSRLEPEVGERISPSGFHLTLGYGVTAKSQLLVRWDRYAPGGSATESDVVLLGYNLTPSRATGLQINLLEDLSGDDGVQLLVNLQLAF